jgi:AI-2 transport protein TqsA
VQQHILNLLTNTVGTVFGLISGTFFSIIFVMFIVMGRDPYAQHSEVYNNIVGKVRRYIGTKVVISLITGVLVWLALDRVVDLPLAGVFGILAFLLNFIPSIGSIFSTMLPIPVAVAQFQGTDGEIVWGMVILAVLLPGAVQITMGNVIEPKLMGGGLNLHPVTVLLALSFWGLLWGIPGMFLAAPITAAIRIVLMQFDTLRPFGRVLAGDFSPPVKEELAEVAPAPPREDRASKQAKKTPGKRRSQSKRGKQPAKN